VYVLIVYIIHYNMLSYFTYIVYTLYFINKRNVTIGNNKLIIPVQHYYKKCWQLYNYCGYLICQYTNNKLYILLKPSKVFSDIYFPGFGNKQSKLFILVLWSINRSSSSRVCNLFDIKDQKINIPTFFTYHNLNIPNLFYFK